MTAHSTLTGKLGRLHARLHGGQDVAAPLCHALAEALRVEASGGSWVGDPAVGRDWILFAAAEFLEDHAHCLTDEHTRRSA